MRDELNRWCYDLPDEAADRIRELEAEVADAAALLTDCAQLIDPVKVEWSQDGSWTEWDQSIRDRISGWLEAYYRDRPPLDRAELSRIIHDSEDDGE